MSQGKKVCVTVSHETWVKVQKLPRSVNLSEKLRKDIEKILLEELK